METPRPAQTALSPTCHSLLCSLSLPGEQEQQGVASSDVDQDREMTKQPEMGRGIETVAGTHAASLRQAGSCLWTSDLRSNWQWTRSCST